MLAGIGRGHWDAPERFEAPERAATPPRALVLDADPALARQIGLALRRLGIQTETCTSAHEALARVRHERYTVAVVDTAVPGGHDTVRALRRRARVPVVAFSAEAALADRLRSRLSGCRAHVAKPASLERFVNVVARAAGLAGDEANPMHDGDLLRLARGA